jgi:hypothetical protein
MEIKIDNLDTETLLRYFEFRNLGGRSQRASLPY